jgi:hypothetical protein
MLVVYIFTMYISAAPFVSQMHASAQHQDDDGVIRSAHKVPRGRAARACGWRREGRVGLQPEYRAWCPWGPFDFTLSGGVGTEGFWGLCFLSTRGGATVTAASCEI